MANNKGDGLGNKPVIVVIGLIASCIAIFTFITGKQSIMDIISTPFAQPEFLNTPFIIENTATLTEKPSPTIILNTPVPTNADPTTTPMAIDSTNPGVSITIRDLHTNSSTGQGSIRIQFLAGNEPLRNVGISFYQTAQDISGKWTLVKQVTRNGGSTVSGNTDENGIIEETLDSGNYSAFNDGWHDGNLTALVGTWGVKAFYFDHKDPVQTILFPIQAGKLTDIKVSLAHLEIGVVDKNGKAVKNRLVSIFCQAKDVTNKKIPADCGDNANQYDVAKTDYTGLASFNLGAGTYVIVLVSINFEGDYYFYNIAVQPGESRRDILTVNK